MCIYLKLAWQTTKFIYGEIYNVVEKMQFYQEKVSLELIKAD